MTSHYSQSINWSELNLNGLYPGMALSDAMDMNWCQERGILLPADDNPLRKLGIFYSANWENDTIVAVSGGALFEGQRLLLSSGEDLMAVLDKLPFTNSKIKNEALDRTIMIVEDGPIVESIYFSMSSWVAQASWT